MARDDGFVSLEGVPLMLPPKERAVLHLLVRRWPDVVTKDEFASTIWRRQAMSDESLARCVTQLRRLLPAANRPGHPYGVRDRLPARSAKPPAAACRAGATADAVRHAATLAHARQLVLQRTPAGILRAEQLLRGLLAQAPQDAAAGLALAECLASAVNSGMAVQRDALGEAQRTLATTGCAARRLARRSGAPAGLPVALWRGRAAPCERRRYRRRRAGPLLSRLAPAVHRPAGRGGRGASCGGRPESFLGAHRRAAGAQLVGLRPGG